MKKASTILMSLDSLFPNDFGFGAMIAQMGNVKMKRIVFVSAFMLFPVAMLFLALGILAVNVPYWDDYGAIVRYMGWPFAERMQHLFDFHNEHRIVTVRLFLEAMVALTGKVNFKACMIFGTAQLLVILACFAWFQVGQFGSRLGFALLAAASWHLFSMLNFDNAFWALTALENFGVLMWAFLAIILFQHRARTLYFVLSLVCALLATLTSAQGLAVFGALCAMSLVPTDTECASAAGNGFARRTFAHMRKPSALCGFVAAALISVLAGALYFSGFNKSGDALTAAKATVWDKVLYIMAFLGNLVPIYPVALLCGFAVAVAIAFIVFRFPRLPSRLHPVFFFMVYLVGVAVAGVAFRGSDPRAALSFRYYVITACLFISVTMLLVALLGSSLLIVRMSVPVLVVGFALLDLGVFIVGWPMFAERNEALRVNMLTWPKSLEGLRVDDDYRGQASLELMQLERLGRYDRQSIMKKGETVPGKPIPWPTPHVP